MKLAIRHGIRYLGLGLFAWILSQSDLETIQLQLSEISIPESLAAVLLFYPILWIKAARWKKLLPGTQATSGTWFRTYATSYYAGSVTPGRVGELSRIALARGMGAPTGSAVLAAFADRLLDLVALVALAGLGVFAFEIVSGPIAAGAAALTLIAFAFRKRLLSLIQAALDRLVPFPVRIADAAHVLSSDVVVLTVAAWCLCVGQILLFASALDLEVTGVSLISAYAISAIVAAVPVTLAGIGTRDVVLITLFSAAGGSAEQAIAFSAALLANYLLQMALSFPFWMVASGGRAGSLGTAS